MGAVLRALASVLPDRISVLEDEGWFWIRGTFWGLNVSPEDRPADEVMVEATLREEIEARGWAWELQHHGQHCRAAIWQGPIWVSRTVIARADSPAHALASALLAALAPADAQAGDAAGRAG
jgi:hypothetical protein